MITEIKEIRTIETAFRMEFDKGMATLSGLAVPYNVISDYTVPENPLLKEVISVGAFKRSVETDDIRLLWQHLPQYVLGRNRAGTLKLFENEKGVFFEAVPPDVQWSRDLVQSIKRRDISQCSFKFGGTAHYERAKDGGYVQIVDEGRLEEISIVTVPVYNSTSVYSRSAEGGLLVNGKLVEVVDREREKASEKVEINLDDLWARLEAVNKRNSNSGGY